MKQGRDAFEQRFRESFQPHDGDDPSGLGSDFVAHLHQSRERGVAMAEGDRRGLSAVGQARPKAQPMHDRAARGIEINRVAKHFLVRQDAFVYPRLEPIFVALDVRQLNVRERVES